MTYALLSHGLPLFPFRQLTLAGTFFFLVQNKNWKYSKLWTNGEGGSMDNPILLYFI